MHLLELSRKPTHGENWDGWHRLPLVGERASKGSESPEGKGMAFTFSSSATDNATILPALVSLTMVRVSSPTKKNERKTCLPKKKCQNQDLNYVNRYLTESINYYF